MTSGTKKGLNWDRIGAMASMVCAVHCLLTGVALGLLSVVGFGFVGSLWADVAFIGFALLVGVTAIIHGYRKHHSLIPSLIFCSALASIGIAFAAFRDNSVGHTVFSVMGGLGLVTFHVLNLRFGHNCAGQCTCSHDHQAHDVPGDVVSDPVLNEVATESEIPQTAIAS